MEVTVDSLCIGFQLLFLTYLSSCVWWRRHQWHEMLIQQPVSSLTCQTSTITSSPKLRLSGNNGHYSLKGLSAVMAAAPQDRPNLMIGCRLVGWIGQDEDEQFAIQAVRRLFCYLFLTEVARTHLHTLRHSSAFSSSSSHFHSSRIEETIRQSYL